MFHAPFGRVELVGHQTGSREAGLFRACSGKSFTERSWTTPAVPCSSRKPPMEKMGMRRRSAMPGNHADRPLSDLLTGGLDTKEPLKRVRGTSSF